MPPNQLDDLIDDIFGNILDLRETNRHLLEVLYVRQREEGPIIQQIGDLFLDAATEFRYAYPTYIGHLPVSEKRLKEELESNNAFRLFLEVGHLGTFLNFSEEADVFCTLFSIAQGNKRLDLVTCLD